MPLHRRGDNCEWAISSPESAAVVAERSVGVERPARSGEAEDPRQSEVRIHESYSRKEAEDRTEQ